MKQRRLHLLVYLTSYSNALLTDYLLHREDKTPMSNIMRQLLIDYLKTHMSPERFNRITIAHTRTP